MAVTVSPGQPKNFVVRPWKWPLPSVRYEPSENTWPECDDRNLQLTVVFVGKFTNSRSTNAHAAVEQPGCDVLAPFVTMTRAGSVVTGSDDAMALTCPALSTARTRICQVWSGPFPTSRLPLSPTFSQAPSLTPTLLMLI